VDLCGMISKEDSKKCMHFMEMNLPYAYIEEQGKQEKNQFKRILKNPLTYLQIEL
jgi:hypothetical protein